VKPLTSILLFTVALLLLGCSKSPAPESVASPTPQNTPAAVDKSTLGAISGTVSFKGIAPKLRSLDMSQDPACPTEPQPADVVLVKNGKLANVLVYIKSGLPQAAYSPPSEPVVLDQKGCRYIPHVLAVMAGQPLKVLNNDNAEHNVHPMPKQNAAWNESQMPRGEPIVKTFQHPEIMMPVQCNQHPWMQMYLSVLEHPFFAVSAEDGSFQIRDLPPGDYTLAAIHEKFGEQTMKVTVAPKLTVSANFAFSAAQK
jgi:plastocyanin